MIVVCEKCGRKYNIDPAKIRAARVKFKCKTCNHMIMVTKPIFDTLESAMPAEPQLLPSPPRVPVERMEGPTEEHGQQETTAQKKIGQKTKRLGLRTKMLILFLFIPIILIAAAGGLYLWQLDDLSSLLTNESSRVVTHMAEDMIADTARAVATQSKLFLQTHPDLKKNEFNKDMDFKKVALQKVGMTGYTAFYEIPGSDGAWRTWAHVNPKIIGIDMIKLKKPLGKNFHGFWKVYTGVKAGKESRGYYTWRNKDGKIRDKFMVCTPIEGTPYVVAATTYLDEFTQPMKVLEARANKLAIRTRNVTFAILGATLILIGFIVAFYGHRLTERIRTLTHTADRISVGELDAEIEVKSKDELGGLADAIVRMQESIRLSIERLRRRK